MAPHGSLAHYAAVVQGFGTLPAEERTLDVCAIVGVSEDAFRAALEPTGCNTLHHSLIVMKVRARGSSIRLDWLHVHRLLYA